MSQMPTVTTDWPTVPTNQPNPAIINQNDHTRFCARERERAIKKERGD